MKYLLGSMRDINLRTGIQSSNFVRDGIDIQNPETKEIIPWFLFYEDINEDRDIISWSFKTINQEWKNWTLVIMND